MGHRYKVRYIKRGSQMTKEEQREWVRQWANLALDSLIEKYGYLPRPPTDAEIKQWKASLE
jgi:hypothetical protein